MKLVEQFHDGRARHGVEVARGLVCQQQRRIADNSAGDGNALTLAARHLMGLVIEAVGQSNANESSFSFLSSFSAWYPEVEKAVGDVIDRVHAFREVELLEDEADEVSAQSRQLAVREPRDVDPIDLNRARGGTVEGPDEVEQGGLARPRRADDRDEFPPLDCEADPGAGRHGRFAIGAAHVMQ